MPFLSLPKIVFAAFPLLLLTCLAAAEGELFDPEAARMMKAAQENSAESTPHEASKPPARLSKLPPPIPTKSLAQTSTSLSPEQQRIFGPKSGSRQYDPRMIAAAHIAKERAQPRMTWYCWRYVKNALLASGLVDSRPETAFAKNAGQELCAKYGFVKLAVTNPLKAPVGAVVVYGGNDAGHVELRTENGFVSDFVSRTPYPRPLVGVYVKPS